MKNCLLPWCFPGQGACCVQSHRASWSSPWPSPLPLQWVDPRWPSRPAPAPAAWSLAPDKPCPDPCSDDPDSECTLVRPCTDQGSKTAGDHLLYHVQFKQPGLLWKMLMHVQSKTNIIIIYSTNYFLAGFVFLFHLHTIMNKKYRHSIVINNYRHKQKWNK